MTKTAQTDTELPIDDLDEDALTEEDYAFILGPNGEIKTIIVPDTFEIDPPASVKKVLKALGVKDLELYFAEGETLH
jgi:hypothetical protein